MKLKRMIPLTILVMTIVLAWSFQAGAYGVFESAPPEAGNCSQCHTDFPGATHSVHTAAFGCSECHVGSPGANPVLVSACAACHDAGDLFMLHGGIETPSGEYCGFCHENVGAEHHTFTELKNIFE